MKSIKRTFESPRVAEWWFYKITQTLLCRILQLMNSSQTAKVNEKAVGIGMLQKMRVLHVFEEFFYIIIIHEDNSVVRLKRKAKGKFPYE